MKITIERFLNNGFGLARNLEGEIVFVKNALPGEVVRLDEAGLVRKKGVLWADEFKLEEPSDSRTQPDCPHGWRCGGCATLHIRPQDELDLKTQAITDNLKRLAHWADMTIERHDFPRAQSRYRGKLHANGTHLGWKVASSDQLVQIQECRVLPLPIQQNLAPLQQSVAKLQFQGEVYFAVHPESQKALLSFHGRTGHPKGLSRLGDLPGIAGVIYSDPRGRRRQHWGERTLNFSWPPFAVSLAPEQFFQANPKSWPVFHAILNAYLKRFEPRKVWDVHAGSGFLTSALKGRHILATEPDRRAYANLKKNLDRLGWPHRILNHTAETAIEKDTFPLDRLDAAVLDPPRSGLSSKLREWLVSSGPPSLLYFSCDLGTFARDIRGLGSAYVPNDKLCILNVNPGTLRGEYAVILLRQDQ